MKLLIHDLSEKEFCDCLPEIGKDITVIGGSTEIRKCIGCFSCWLKTPASCVIKDKYQNIGQLISRCDEIIIFSECLYGGFSPFVKNVLDRSISYLLPYMEVRGGEMHHKIRYNHQVKFKVIFYGENITQEEKATAIRLISANGLNFNTRENSVDFYQKVNKIKGMVL